MTTTNDQQAQVTEEGGEAIGVAPPPTAITSPFHRGRPTVVGIPMFIAGSIALGLVLVGYINPVLGAGAAINLAFGAAALGTLIACIWSITLGENAVASIYAVFAGFFTSYLVLELGLLHGWFGFRLGLFAGPLVTSLAIHTEAIFLISWLAVVGMLILGTLRLPSLVTLLLFLVEVALALDLTGILRGSTTLLMAAGASTFAFCLIGIPLYLDALNQDLGGRAIPLGRPIARWFVRSR
ncbi:MAG TPA: GPR1/FUN34/YaaH family transporter [Acidimicrobiales bacterium]|nr:GPR1/FUN34/YaaH family transporter [Acidimicrobiales bacterium]